MSGDVNALESYSFGDELLSFGIFIPSPSSGTVSLDNFKYFSSISIIKNIRWLSFAVYPPSSSDSSAELNFVGGDEILDEPLDLLSDIGANRFVLRPNHRCV